MIHLLLVEDDAEIREIITGSSDIRNQCHRKNSNHAELNLGDWFRHQTRGKI